MNRTAAMPPSMIAGRPRRGGRLAALALLALGSQAGCGREFYREWANQDVSEAVFEKSRDPRWRLDMFSNDPPAMARFADPYDPDRPPGPARRLRRPGALAGAAVARAPPDDAGGGDRLPQVPRRGAEVQLAGAGPRARPEAPPLGQPAVRAPAPAGASPSPSPFNPTRRGPPAPPNAGRPAVDAAKRIPGRRPALRRRLPWRPTPPRPQPRRPAKPATQGRRDGDQAVRDAMQDPTRPMPTPGTTNSPTPVPPPSAVTAPGDRLQTPKIPGDPDADRRQPVAPTRPRPDQTPKQYPRRRGEGLQPGPDVRPRGRPLRRGGRRRPPLGQQAVRPDDGEGVPARHLQQPVLPVPARERLPERPAGHAPAVLVPAPVHRRPFAQDRVGGAGSTPSAGCCRPSCPPTASSIRPGPPATSSRRSTWAPSPAWASCSTTGPRSSPRSPTRSSSTSWARTRPSRRSGPTCRSRSSSRSSGAAAGRSPWKALTQAERSLLYSVRVFAKFRQEFVVATLVGGTIQTFGVSTVTAGFTTAGNIDPVDRLPQRGRGRPARRELRQEPGGLRAVRARSTRS